MTERRTRPLDVDDEIHRLMLHLGVAITGLPQIGEQGVEAGDEIYQLVPFVKALALLGLRHPTELRALWEQALREPMPFGGAPLGVPPDPREPES